VAASQLLPGSRLLSYAGWGHTAYFSAGNFCVDSHVTRYLLTGDVPAAGTVCEPEGSPFGPTSAATAWAGWWVGSPQPDGGAPWPSIELRVRLVELVLPIS
jgi:hypothetical protein